MDIYGIDFDGTCVDHHYPKVGEDVPGAVAVLSQLVDNGHLLVLNTMRSDGPLQLAVDWFAKHNLPLYGVNETPDQREWTNSPKVYAHFYIDDAAVGCPLIHPDGFARQCVDWEKIARLIESREDE